MSEPDRINLLGNQRDAMKAFEGVEHMLDTSGLSAQLRHLLKLRASQMNGCAFCVEMHTREARADGETNSRLDHVVVWREAGCYSEEERAMFAWTEALTDLNATHDLDGLFSELARHFSQSQIAAMTTQIAMINVWNRIQVASHGRRGTARATRSGAA